MIKNPPGPRLTGALRLSGSELKRAQTQRATNCDPGRQTKRKHFFKEKRKRHQKNRKVNVSTSAGATPHGHVAFVRFGAETQAKNSRRFCDFGVRILVIVEGRATKEGRKKKTGRTKKEEEQQESKKSKFDPYTP